MRRILWNEGWKFKKAEEDTFRDICLPHDAMLEEKRSKDAPSGAGGAYFAGGSYVYEKHFQIEEADENCCVIAEFGGVYQKAQIYLNDVLVAESRYGYLNIWADLSEYIRRGADNVIRVLADNSKTPNSRWYSGAGIYRPVRLWLSAKTHIKPQGIKVQTLSYNPAQIRVDADVENLKLADEVHIEICDGNQVVASERGANAVIDVPDAKLWSAKHPYQYVCRVFITRNGTIMDEGRISFGIRKLEWSTKGFFVNGEETLLKGTCLHHDNGILGACSYKEAEYRKVKILKEAGFNAIRSAHNPVGEELAEVCDELGMYIMDEAWDMWYKSKNVFDYSLDFMECYQKDIAAMVARDYNHPSIVMYSIGNEITEPCEEKGNELARKLAELFRKEDATRAVTVGCNLILITMAAMEKAKGNEIQLGEVKEIKQIDSTEFNKQVSQLGKRMTEGAKRPDVDKLATPCLDAVDIAGYNYAQTRYEMEAKIHPDRIIVGSETYPQDVVKNWALVKKLPYVIGDFMWVGWDYIGEVGIGAWSYEECSDNFIKPYPWLLAGSGAFDLIGTPTGEAAQAATVYLEQPQARIFVKPVNHSGEEPARSAWRGTNSIESWSFAGCEGRQAEIEVYSSAPEVELFLNEQCLGRKKTEENVAIFSARYESGMLRAVAYNGTKSVAEQILGSASEKRNIQICPEKTEVESEELFFAEVNICGDNGVVESNADTQISLQVENGTLLGFGSANPRSPESFLSGSYTSYYGRTLAAIRAGNTGSVKITASAADYESVCKEVKINEESKVGRA